MTISVGDSTRLPNDIEYKQIAEYASHAIACSLCFDPRTTLSLCSKGYRLAGPISRTFASFRGRIFSLKDFRGSFQIVGIIVPQPYLDIIAKLIEAFQAGMRIKTRRPDDKPRHRQFCKCSKLQRHEATKDGVQAMVKYSSHCHSCPSRRPSLTSADHESLSCSEESNHARNIHELRSLFATGCEPAPNTHRSEIIKLQLREEISQTTFDSLTATGSGLDISGKSTQQDGDTSSPSTKKSFPKPQTGSLDSAASSFSSLLYGITASQPVLPTSSESEDAKMPIVKCAMGDAALVDTTQNATVTQSQDLSRKAIPEQAVVMHPETIMGANSACVQITDDPDNILSHSAASTINPTAAETAFVAEVQPQIFDENRSHAGAFVRNWTGASKPAIVPESADIAAISQSDVILSRQSQQQLDADYMDCVYFQISEAQQPHPGQSRQGSALKLRDARIVSCGNEIMSNPLIYSAAKLSAGVLRDLDASSPVKGHYAPYRRRWLDDIPIRTYRPGEA